MTAKPVIIIPAYRPDERLVKLVKRLREESDIWMIVDDDGSGSAHEGIFEQLTVIEHCMVCAHEINKGKGVALKTGIRYALRKLPDSVGVVTVDADGQHAPEDALRVMGAMGLNPDCLILGVRDFSKSQVPFKSRWGNRITRLVFRWAVGVYCSDTQTGLRGIPRTLAEKCLNMPGERFEHELNVLLYAAKEKWRFKEVPVQTIYMDGNRSSHFHAVRDSTRIYANILKYGASSLCCALADIGLFAAIANSLDPTPQGFLCATVFARLTSGVLNFVVNKKWVFKSARRNKREMLYYTALFFTQMLVSWLLVNVLTNVLPSATLSKVIVDMLLFFISYVVQRKLVFRPDVRVTDLITGGVRSE